MYGIYSVITSLSVLFVQSLAVGGSLWWSVICVYVTAAGQGEVRAL